MPFGKHKDKDMSEIPKPYLRWLRGQEWVGGWLAYALDEALGEVDQKQHPPNVGQKPVKKWEPSDE